MTQEVHESGDKLHSSRSPQLMNQIQKKRNNPASRKRQRISKPFKKNCKNEAEIITRQTKEMESKLEKMLKELEESKSSHKNRDCADNHLEPDIIVAPPPLRSSAPEQTQHVDYARMFLNTKEKSAPSIPGMITLLANELERDLHLTDLVIETSTATNYAPPLEKRYNFSHQPSKF